MMLKFRKATIEDSRIYFDWANDTIVREHSYNSNMITWENHAKWFSAKINDTSCLMLIFQDELNNNIGQIRIQKESNRNALVGISIALEQRGKGYAIDMLNFATEYFLSENPEFCINAFIKEHNLSSKHAFEKAGFVFFEMTTCEGFRSFHYIKNMK